MIGSDCVVSDVDGRIADWDINELLKFHYLLLFCFVSSDFSRDCAGSNRKPVASHLEEYNRQTQRLLQLSRSPALHCRGCSRSLLSSYSPSSLMVSLHFIFFLFNIQIGLSFNFLCLSPLWMAASPMTEVALSDIFVSYLIHFKLDWAIF